MTERSVRRASAAHADRIRRRIAAEPELELSHEEMRVLADHDIDPEEVRRIALADRVVDEVSDHDRPTAREDLEALVVAEEDDPSV